MRTILTLTSIGLLLSAGALWSGCGGGTGSSAAAVAITASTTQLGDFARQVAGDRGQVTQILAANSDPHEYEPTPSDAESIVDADLVLESGGDLDLWLPEVVESSGSSAPLLTLLDSIETRPDSDGAEDPHWWQDPQNAIIAVERIRDQLDDVDPDGASDYDANARSYIAKLTKLDDQIAGCIDKVPATERKLVTSHDALGYYADRYGIEVIGAAIPALSTQAQPSAGQTTDLIEVIRQTGVSTIFAEAGVSRELEETIATEAGASLGGELWADTLGPEGSDGATYIEAMAANTAKLVAGFTNGEQSCVIDVG